MKYLFRCCLLFIFLLGNNFLTFSQSAHVQFIHNSPDTSLSTVDIYINGSPIFTAFKFRQASSFITLPASGVLSIGIARSNSTGVNDTVKNINIILQKDSSYYIVTSGVLDTNLYIHNPNGTPINFAIKVFPHAFVSNNNLNTYCGLQFFNGASDTPQFNLYGREQKQMLFSETGYGQFGTSYVPEITYQPVIIDLINPSNGQVLSTYLANFNNLYRQSILIFSSGFQNPSQNQNGAPFGLFAVLTNGTVIQLTDTAIASLQLIHNAADTAAIGFDIYLNGNLLVSPLYFRTATSYLDVPANELLHLGIAAAFSNSVADVTDSFTFTLQNAGNYVAMLSGVLDTTGFIHNPNGRNINLNLYTKHKARQTASDTSLVDIFFFHGSTDKPALDIKLSGSSTLLADNIMYGDTSDYSELTASQHNFDITTGGHPEDVLATYEANLGTFTGRSLTVFASGFADSIHNHHGPSFGLFAALNDGSIVQFPLIYSSAQVQFIHNSADPSLASVDVYINGILTLNDFHFRKATYFSGVQAGAVLNIGIAHDTSASVKDTFANIQLTLIPNSTNVLMLNGVQDTLKFASNPNGKNRALALSLLDSVNTKTGQSNTVSIKMIHGSTDEPVNDFIMDGTLPPFINDIQYLGITPYSETTTASHNIYMADASNDADIIKKYIGNFASYGGSSLTVFSSGFLSPSANQNGSAFGLYAADTSGNVFPLTDITSTSNIPLLTGITVYPNPASDYINVVNKTGKEAEIQLVDISGRQIKDFGYISDVTSQLSIEDIPSGLYIINLISERGISHLPLIIQK